MRSAPARARPPPGRANAARDPAFPSRSQLTSASEDATARPASSARRRAGLGRTTSYLYREGERRARLRESPQARALGFFFPPRSALSASLSLHSPCSTPNAHKEAGRRGQADRSQADRQGRVQGLRDGGVEGGEGLRERGGERSVF